MTRRMSFLSSLWLWSIGVLLFAASAQADPPKVELAAPRQAEEPDVRVEIDAVLVEVDPKKLAKLADQTKSPVAEWLKLNGFERPKAEKDLTAVVYAVRDGEASFDKAFSFDVHGQDVRSAFEILSRPTVRSSSGQAAVVQIGQTLPSSFGPKPSHWADLDALKARMKLAIYPVVHPDGSLLLDMRLENSRLGEGSREDANGGNNPSLSTRALTLAVKLKPGQFLLLANGSSESEHFQFVQLKPRVLSPAAIAKQEQQASAKSPAPAARPADRNSAEQFVGQLDAPAPANPFEAVIAGNTNDAKSKSASTERSAVAELERADKRPIRFDVKVWDVDHAKLRLITKSDSGPFSFYRVNGLAKLPEGITITTPHPDFDLSISPLTAPARAFAVRTNSVSQTLHSHDISSAFKTITEPTLVATNGREATMLSGGEVPIFALQTGDSEAIAFHKFGLKLKILPKLMDQGRIALGLDFENSELDPKSEAGEAGIKLISSQGFRLSAEMKLGEQLLVAQQMGKQEVTRLVQIQPTLFVEQQATTHPAQLIPDSKAVAAKPALSAIPDRQPESPEEFNVIERWPIGNVEVGQVVYPLVITNRTQLTAQSSSIRDAEKSSMSRDKTICRVLAIDQAADGEGRIITLLPQGLSAEERTQLAKEHRTNGKRAISFAFINAHSANVRLFAEEFLKAIPESLLPPPTEMFVGGKTHFPDGKPMLIEQTSGAIELQDIDRESFVVAKAPGRAALSYIRTPSNDGYHVVRREFVVKEIPTAGTAMKSEPPPPIAERSFTAPSRVATSPAAHDLTVEDRWPIDDVKVGEDVIPAFVFMNRNRTSVGVLSPSHLRELRLKVVAISKSERGEGLSVTLRPSVSDSSNDALEELQKLTDSAMTCCLLRSSGRGFDQKAALRDVLETLPASIGLVPVELAVEGVFRIPADEDIEVLHADDHYDIEKVDGRYPEWPRLIAKKPGLGRLIYAQGASYLAQMEILVKADTRELELHIRQQFPKSKVSITSLGTNSLLLTGSAESDEDSHGIVELAQQFAPKVLNRLKVGAEEARGGAKIEIQSSGGQTKVRTAGSSEEIERAIDSATNVVPVMSKLRQAAHENSDDVIYQPVPDSTGERGPPRRTPLAESLVAEPQRVRPRKAVGETSSKSAELEQLRNEIRELRQDVRELIQRLDREQVAAPKQNVDAKPADAETQQRLIGDSVSKLLKRACDASKVPVAGKVSDVKKRICFIGVANGTDNDVGQLKNEIYELIDTAISESLAYQSVNRRYVEAGMKQLRLRSDEILLKEDQRNFVAVMEEMGQSFDELLVATLTADKTQQSNELKRDYVLTLELLNIHSGVSLKESATLRNARLVSEFNNLTLEFNEFMEQQRFAEAEVIAKQAVELDPNNPLAVTMRMRAAFARRVFTNEQQQPAIPAPAKATLNAGEPWKPAPLAHESVIENAWQMLGLRLAPLTESERKQLHSKYQGGMKVTEVRADSPASQNKIRKDDILVGLHVWETTSFDNLQFVLGHPHILQHGTLKFYILRGTETLFGELKIVTPAMPMPSNIRIDPPRQPRSIALSDLPNKLETEFDKLKLHIEVHRALIDTALEARGITVTDDEARQFLQVHADRDQIPYELFQQAMKHTPMGQQFLQATRQQLALVKHSGQTTEPTEQELRDAYQLAQAGRVASRQLSFADKAKASEVARELHANPQRFEEIAAKHGQPPNAFPGRTLIPTVPPSPIDEVLAQLKDGEISDVTPMGDQFVIYQRQQIVKPQGTFDDLKPQLRATLIINKTNEIGQREIEKLRKEYRLIVVPAGAASAASGSTKPNPAQTPLHNAEWKSSALQTGPPAEAVAIVNGEVISYRDLARWGSPLKELDGPVNLLLLKQAAKNAKLDISSKEIDAEVLQQASKFKLPIDQWYSMLEKERGISRDHYRDLVTFPMLVLRRLAGDDTKQQLTYLAGLRAAAKIELVDPDAKLPPVNEEATEPAPTTSVPDEEKPSE